MKDYFSKIRYLIFLLTLINFLELKADNYSFDNILGKESELLIESNKQRSDLKNSIFYADGDVLITNKNKEFIARSEKAIFYKLIGKVNLIGDVEVHSGDINKLKADEVIYYLNENKLEAIAAKNQKVITKFVFNKDNIVVDKRK